MKCGGLHFCSGGGSRLSGEPRVKRAPSERNVGEKQIKFQAAVAAIESTIAASAAGDFFMIFPTFRSLGARFTRGSPLKRLPHMHQAKQPSDFQQIAPHNKTLAQKPFLA